jgi:N-acetylmuramoyl-L-alanine amidase
VSWSRAAGRHHAEARSAAERILSSLVADGGGPARMRVARTYVTEGADCPAILLECATLGHAEERMRLTAPDGIRGLAQSVGRALERYSEGGALP